MIDWEAQYIRARLSETHASKYPVLVRTFDVGVVFLAAECYCAVGRVVGGKDEVGRRPDSGWTEWKRPRLWPVVVTSTCPVINGIISG